MLLPLKTNSPLSISYLPNPLLTPLLQREAAVPIQRLLRASAKFSRKVILSKILHSNSMPVQLFPIQRGLTCNRQNSMARYQSVMVALPTGNLHMQICLKHKQSQCGRYSEEDELLFLFIVNAGLFYPKMNVPLKLFLPD